MHIWTKTKKTYLRENGSNWFKISTKQAIPFIGMEDQRWKQVSSKKIQERWPVSLSQREEILERDERRGETSDSRVCTMYCCNSRNALLFTYDVELVNRGRGLFVLQWFCVKFGKGREYFFSQEFLLDWIRQ